MCICSETVYCTKDLIKQSGYFLYLPIVEQLKCILEECKLGQFLQKPQTDSTNLSEVCDGFLYKIFGGGKLLKLQHALSLLFNTDGVPVFESSGASIWPI